MLTDAIFGGKNRCYGPSLNFLWRLFNTVNKIVYRIRYFSDKIFPFVLNHPKITYSGNLGGARKTKFVSEAKALLFPIDWEEPFGMAVIEALACGTPVIAMNRGAMPEMIEHGKNGFLANNEVEFEEYMNRIDEIDPAMCRESVERNFSSEKMASQYVERYEEVLRRSNKDVVSRLRNRLSAL